MLACARDGKEEHDNPRDADFRPHFQVNRANSRIESGAHEDIVYEVTRHAHLFTTCDGPKISSEGYSEAPDHGDGHNVAIIVDDLGQTEYVVIMEERGSNKGEVDGVERIAVVHEGLVSERWHGQSLLHITWHDPREEELIEDETGIHLPRVEVRAGILDEGEAR